MGIEQRKHPRFEVKLDVTFAKAAERTVLTSENLSLGGVFLVADDDPAKVGDDVTLAISVPGDDAAPKENADSTAFVGTVVHAVPPLGFGVRFDWDKSSGEAKARLESFLTRLSSLAKMSG